MMNANEKLNKMLNFALEQKELSKCTDKKTSAILVSRDLTQIYSIGINGGPIKGEQCMCKTCGTKAKFSCAHAEMNCLVKNTTINNVPKIMICSKQPCAICATLIVNSQTNIQQVYYNEEYWNTEGLEILRKANIEVIRFGECENDGN